MSRWIARITVFVLLGVLVNQQAGAQDDAAAFLKASAPAEQHKKLQSLVGSWDLAIKIPMGPDGKPAEVKGNIAYKSILGGRFIQEEAKTEIFGRPFEWVGMYGYDKTQSKYVAIWADSFNTIIEHGDGDADEAGKSVTLVGHTVRPGGMKEKFHWVITFPVDGKLSIDMFSVNKDDSRGPKMMEMTGTKAK